MFLFLFFFFNISILILTYFNLNCTFPHKSLLPLTMAGPPSLPMAGYQSTLQLRLIHNTNAPTEAAQHIAGFCFKEGILFRNYGFAARNPSAVIFHFCTVDHKDTLLQHKNFNKLLADNNFQPLNQNPIPEANINHRTVFINNLQPSFFYQLDNQTIEDVIILFDNDLKSHAHGENIEHTHYHRQHTSDGQPAGPPRTMLITFKTLDAAKAFIDCDTFVSYGTILKRNKRFHRPINRVQCTLCRKVGHRAVESAKCDKTPRCPQCFSTEHQTPNACRPWCENCKLYDRHTTGSAKCDTNRAAVKSIRSKLDQKERQHQRLASTTDENRAFHADIVKLKNQFSSYGAAAKAGLSSHQPPPNPPTPSQPPPPSPSTPQSSTTPSTSFTSQNVEKIQVVMTSAFMAGCLAEAIAPGQDNYQNIINDYYECNGLPKISHPSPPQSVIDAIKPIAKASLNALITSTPNNTLSDTLTASSSFTTSEVFKTPLAPGRTPQRHTTPSGSPTPSSKTSLKQTSPSLSGTSTPSAIQPAQSLSSLTSDSFSDASSVASTSNRYPVINPDYLSQNPDCSKEDYFHSLIWETINYIDKNPLTLKLLWTDAKNTRLAIKTIVSTPDYISVGNLHKLLKYRSIMVVHNEVLPLSEILPEQFKDEPYHLSHILNDSILSKAAAIPDLNELNIHYKICPISLNENKFLVNNPEFVALYWSIEQTNKFPIGISSTSVNKITHNKVMKKLRSDDKMSIKSIKDLLDENLINIQPSCAVSLSKHPILTIELIYKAASNSFLSTSHVRYTII